MSQFFSLPGSGINGIPIVGPGGKKLSFGLLEIGCKPQAKKDQLKLKRSLLGTHCKALTLEDLEWGPRIFCSLVHWFPLSQYDPNNTTKTHIDLGIFYNSISDSIMTRFTREEREKIFNFVRGYYEESPFEGSLEKELEFLTQILQKENPQEIYKVIANEQREFDDFPLVRGSLAERLSLLDIKSAIPEGMNFFENGEVKGINGHYPKGTEIDGIMTFYGKKGSTFREFASYMSEKPHVSIMLKKLNYKKLKK